MTVRAVIKGCGHYLPKRIVENSEFEQTLDTSDEWISSRSGIRPVSYTHLTLPTN